MQHEIINGLHVQKGENGVSYACIAKDQPEQLNNLLTIISQAPCVLWEHQRFAYHVFWSDRVFEIDENGNFQFHD